ncbi:MAG TPA: PEP-CTERM sorting domain-containing protein [Verrucomicrobiales bacterium]|jgi:hypothetical protein|nr:PEP-CTERM sorting domain-containing protein [Verrucomicrobiales bacterium]
MNLRNSLFVAVVCAATLGGTGDSRAFLLANGNFDRTHAVEVAPGFFLPQPNNWTNQASRAISGPYFDDLSSEPWAGPSPTPETTDGNLNGPPPDGFNGPDGGVFFKAFTGSAANGAATAHLYQDVAGVAGRQYTLTGWAGAEANYLAAQSILAIDFLNAGNSVISSVELNLVAAGLFTPNGMPFNYKQYSVSGISPPNTAAVRARVSMIGGQNNPAGGGQAFVVDDFVLVPEPSTAALAAAGILGLLGRRRSRATG